jgi:hypothetical protein
MPRLLQIHPAMKTMLARPVTTLFSCPRKSSASTSSAGAQIMAMVPNTLSFINLRSSLPNEGEHT